MLTAEFDARTGALRRLFGLDVDGPRLELWRAPTDNDRSDRASTSSDRVGRRRAAGASAGLDRLVHRVVAVDPDGPVGARPGRRRRQRPDRRRHLPLDRHRRGRPARRGRALAGLGLHLAAGGRPVRPAAHAAPGRAGSARGRPSRTRTRAGGPRRPVRREPGRAERPLLPPAGDRAPGRAADAGGRRRRRASGSGCGPIPGPAGHRPGFTLTAHTPQELDRARHPHELAPPTRTYLFLDDAVHGLGSAACGVDVAPEHSLWPGARAFEVVFAAP